MIQTMSLLLCLGLFLCHGHQNSMNLRFVLADHELIEGGLTCFQVVGEQDTSFLSLPEILRVRVANGLSDKMNIQRPGTYVLILDRLKVQNVSKANRLVIQSLTLGWHEITS